MGQGWVAEEALSISLYCALVAQSDFKTGILLAINHSGDSDSTGAITGNVLGALLGKTSIPPDWLARLELREEISKLADDIFRDPSRDDEWSEEYPPW
jgi:ADP-ribosylglycohydrolase